MRVLSYLIAFLSISATKAVNVEFAGFTCFPNWAGYYTDLSNMPQGFRFSDGSTLPAALQKDLCAYEDNCDTFTEWEAGRFRSLQFNSTFDIYLGSDVTKFAQSVCSNETGGSYIPSQQYLKCTDDFGNINNGQILNSFHLPPSLIHSSCLQDNRCVGFRVRRDQSGGDTIGLDSGDGAGYFKIPRDSSAFEKARFARAM